MTLQTGSDISSTEDLRLRLPLPVGQDLSEGRPDVEAVQLEGRDQLLHVQQSRFS